MIEIYLDYHTLPISSQAVVTGRLLHDAKRSAVMAETSAEIESSSRKQYLS